MATDVNDIAESHALPPTITPWQAIEQLETCIGGSVATKEAIADKIRDGAIRAFARAIWTHDGADPKVGWESAPKISKNSPSVAIDRRKLIGSKQWFDDARNWKWRKGDFFISKKNGKLLMLKGVTLSKEDVGALQQRHDDRLRNINKGGRNVKADNWTKIWLTVLQMERDGELDQAKLGQKAYFVDQILARFEDPKPLSPSTIKDAMGQVWEKFVVKPS